MRPTPTSSSATLCAAVAAPAKVGVVPVASVDAERRRVLARSTAGMKVEVGEGVGVGEEV